MTHNNRFLGVLVMAGLVANATRAEAAQFTILIKNTTSHAWSPGLVTLSPLIATGAAPQPLDRGYAAYAFASDACVLSDGYCADATCEDGNADVLRQRAGLTLGTDAWLVPALPAGGSATVSVQATATVNPTPQPRISYLARVQDGDEDFVALHRVGAPETMSSGALFDSAGMPVDVVAFELSGYDVNSTSGVDGSGVSCAPTCPPSVGGCFVAAGNHTTGATLAAQPPVPALSNPWMFAAPEGYTTDGLALGDIAGTSSGGSSLVMVLNSNTWGATDASFGKSVVLSSLASSSPTTENVFTVTTPGNDLVGFPMIENLALDAVVGNSQGQFLVSEYAALSPAPGASVFARSADDTSTWTSTGYGYPGTWNMGPSAGDVRTDGLNVGNEVVIPSWSGDLVVLKRDTAETLNTYSFFTAQSGENLFGHVAIADVHPSAGNEIVAFGAATGTVYVMSAPAEGTELSVLWSSVPPAGLYASGSGPSVADLDGDGLPEIIVAGGGTNEVFAYDPTYSAGCKYKWTIPGAWSYVYSSPVVGDVDGDGNKDVVVFSSNSLLSVLGVPQAPTLGECATGIVSWSYTVANGGNAWFSPALADLTGNGALDIVVASFTTLEVVDASLQQVAFRFSDPTATFYDSPVIEGRTSGRGPAASIYVSGWANGKVYRLTTPSDSPVPADWTTYMGNNRRTGAR